jgi:probable rRNA maturation factor
MVATVELANHHPSLAVDLDRQTESAEAALPLVLAQRGGGEAPLSSLERVEISIVDDPTIADVHARFMDLPDPTDVITFDHGEILISADTASRNADDFGGGHDRDREIALYAIHGLLHLNGHEDKTPQGAKEMAEVQERILSVVWPAERGV